MRIHRFRRRSDPRCQRCFAFIERPLRHEWWFKRLIVLTTFLVIAVILRIVPRGRDLSAEITSRSREIAHQLARRGKSRSEIDDSWRRFRQTGIEETRTRLDRFYAEAEPADQRLMRYAGMDPEHGLLRWGNYNWTLLLSSKVFEAEDEGRSYRFRPLTHSIWLTNAPFKRGVFMFFIVPDGPGLADAIRGTTAIPLETSRQTTNSWGLRGPEPDLVAPLRGIVLGDSFMEGMFIGDDETPPECLRRYLRDHLKTAVSILNTGVMGYSPEQYYYSLIAFADRFRPQFVVVSVFANDFGNVRDVSSRGAGDWREGQYWLEKILKYCRARQWPCLVVPAPYEPSMLGKRSSGYYPGTITNIVDVDSLMYLDPIDDFVDAHLKLLNEGKRKGQRPRRSPLFNDDIADQHFSAAGSEVWAACVGRRLILLLEGDGDSLEPSASVREDTK
ncbi:MAG: SGNH/GDSL hydrolase family protein [Isosphaerales bacterium]